MPGEEATCGKLYEAGTVGVWVAEQLEGQPLPGQLPALAYVLVSEVCLPHPEQCPVWGGGGYEGAGSEDGLGEGRAAWPRPLEDLDPPPHTVNYALPVHQPL